MRGLKLKHAFSNLCERIFDEILKCSHDYLHPISDCGMEKMPLLLPKEYTKPDHVGCMQTHEKSPAGKSTKL